MLAHPLLAQQNRSNMLRLPAIISDNMVLQQEKPARIWGWAAPGSKVTVSIAGLEQSATSDLAGKWVVELPPLRSSDDPLEMRVSACGETKLIRNILPGEIWLCSGQSNMEFELHQAMDAVAEIARAKDPKLRFFVPGFHAPTTPDEDCSGQWVECTPQTARGFSAVAYFFGRNLRSELGRPIGLILSANGATAAESWISREALYSEPVLQPIVDGLASRVIDPKGWDMHLPSGLFNGRIAPLRKLPIRGVIWYQGETNSSRAWQYRKLFPLLIQDWRKTWGEDLPFYFVQLANFQKPPKEPVSETWAELREAQALALELPNTGMAVAIDIGDEDDTHPPNKQDVGLRLAGLALSRTYGRKRVDEGPLYRDIKLDGERIRVGFSAVGGGLVARGGALKQFAIAGDDRKFVWADAVIDGESVVVSSPQVPNPVAVRYAWANNPAGCNLYNREGFPAAPFRSDDWPGITDSAHLPKIGTAVQPVANPVLDPLLSPAAEMTGNTLVVDLAKSIERSWDQIKANGYRYGPRQKREPNGELEIWLPYENDRGLYYEISGMKLTPVAPGAPAALSYDGAGDAGTLVLKLHFSGPIEGFRLFCGSAETSLDGAVAGIEFSSDGREWKLLHEITQSGQFSNWIDPKGRKADGLDTRDLYLRAYVRGKVGAVPKGTRFKVSMSGDVMWGDASVTFANAQWKLWVRPKEVAR